MKVRFNEFNFSNSYIWFEFYKAPLPSDISLICNTIRSWHIVGRLGGCNSMNMQLSQALVDRRPSYDAIQGANVTPTTFYGIGDFEIQENLGRVWYGLCFYIFEFVCNFHVKISTYVFKTQDGWRDMVSSG